jgi:hypothetical protein
MSVAGLSVALLGAISASHEPVGANCKAAINDFLTLPNKRTLQALPRSNRVSCWSVIDASNANLNKLNHSVKQGNSWAARYLATNVSQLDGGNLEDALVALGQFSERDMGDLLLFAHQGLLSGHELSDALTMLPLSLSDDPRSQLQRLRSRRGKVLKVGRRDLSAEQEQALHAIDTFASEIRSKNPGSDR